MRKCSLFVLLALVLGGTAHAELILSPATRIEVGMIEAGGALVISDVEYEGGSIERKILGGYGAYGLNDWFDVYGSLGWILDAEPEDWGDSGMGIMLAAGLRGHIWHNDIMEILGYGQIQYTAEDYGEHSELGARVEADGTVTELTLGAVVIYDLTRELSLYGGVELIPYSDGEIEGSGEVRVDTEIPGVGDISVSDTIEGDLERDTPLTLRAGAIYDLGGFFLRGELALVSETTFTIGGGITF